MGRLYKRNRPANALTSAQMLQVLSELKLVALLRDKSVWLAVDPTSAGYLDKCCTGQQDGGPDSAREVGTAVSAWASSLNQVSHGAAGWWPGQCSGGWYCSRSMGLLAQPGEQAGCSAPAASPSTHPPMCCVKVHLIHR